jgi:glycosyltransferase involved in cell wall biosynthesis
MDNLDIENLVKTLSKYKVALAHDYLIKNGGAEKCLVAFHELFPNAPVYTLIYDTIGTNGLYEGWDIRTSYLQNRVGANKYIDYYRLVMPQAVESFNLDEYDIVISDSSSFIKGIITQPKTKHICYMHTPTRFLWFDINKHIGRAKFLSSLKSFIPYFLHKVRIWDTLAAERPDIIIANSLTTKKRISKFYHRDSSVINPPVEIGTYGKRNVLDYYLLVSRLEPHKDIEVAIKSAMLARVKLKIVGSGTDEARLRSMAGSNIEFLGHVSDEEKNKLFQGAIAFLAPQTEDFGITMVEALSHGCPVIANDDGGASEIVQPGKTGILIKDLTSDLLCEVLKSNVVLKINDDDCADSVKKYSTDNFKINILKEIMKAVR